MVTPYNLNQQQHLRHLFGPALAHYYGRKRWPLYLLLTSTTMVLLLFTTGQWADAWFIFLAVGAVLSLQLAALTRVLNIILPKCPGCRERLNKLGHFCPECGSGGLSKPGSQWSDKEPAHCTSCGKDMLQRTPVAQKKFVFAEQAWLRAWREQGRQYRVHACSCCGLYLTETGL